MGAETKICSQCKVDRFFSQFHKNRCRKEGHTPICRFCMKKNYRDPKKAEARAYGQAQRRTVEGRFKQMQGSAKYRELPCALTLSQYTQLVLQPCFYCKGALPEAGTGLDRLNNDLGYTIENVVPCCKACNHIRGSYLTVEETLAVAALLKELRTRKGELQ